MPTVPLGEAESSIGQQNHFRRLEVDQILDLDDTLPSQSMEAVREPVPLPHMKPVNCPHNDKVGIMESN